MAHEVEPESFAAASTAVLDPPDPKLEQQQSAGNVDDAAKTAADAAAKEADAKTAADKAASEKAAAEKSKTDDLSNPNLATVKADETNAVVDDEKKPAGMTDKAWVSWKAKTAEVKAAKQQAAETAAQLKELQTKLDESSKLTPTLEAAKKELEDLKKKLAEYEGEVYVSRVEAHPKYKAEVKGPMDAITVSMQNIAKRYEVPADGIIRAIQEPDEAKQSDLLNEAIADMNEIDKIKVMRAAERYQELRAKADAMRTDAGKQLEEMNREYQAQHEKQTAKTAKDYQDSVETEWEATLRLYPYIGKVDGQDKWNAHLDSTKHSIATQTDVNALPVERVAKGEIALRILPEVDKVAKYYRSEAEKQKARADAAETKMKEYLKTAPGAGGGNGSSAAAENEEDGSFVGSTRAVLHGRA